MVLHCTVCACRVLRVRALTAGLVGRVRVLTVGLVGGAELLRP